MRTSVGESEIEMQASTLNELLQTLIDKNGAVKDILFDPAGQLRGYTLFYVNNAVQNPPDLSMKLNDGDLVLLVPAAAGG